MSPSTHPSSERAGRLRIAFVAQPWDRIVPREPKYSLAIWNCRMAPRMAQMAQVSVYSKSISSRPASEVVEGVEYRRFDTHWDRRLNRLFKPLNRSAAQPEHIRRWYYARYGRRIASQIARQRADVVHIMNFAQLIQPIRANNPRARIVLHMHCDWLAQVEPKLVRPHLRKADLILGCSQFVTRQIAQRFPELGSRCQWLYNGVATDEFIPPVNGPLGSPHIVYVGRVSPEKGVHVLIDAVRLLRLRIPDLRCTIIGTETMAPPEVVSRGVNAMGLRDVEPYFRGGYLDHLKQRAGSDLSCLQFFGHLPHEQLPLFMAQAHVFAFPSVWEEPFGMPVVEAMACSVPVVASRCGGIPEMVQDGRTGLLVTPNNAQELADAMGQLIENRALAREMGAAGATRAAEFTWDAMAQRLMQMYKQLTTDQTARTLELKV